MFFGVIEAESLPHPMFQQVLEEKEEREALAQ